MPISEEKNADESYWKSLGFNDVYRDEEGNVRSRRKWHNFFFEEPSQPPESPPEQAKSPSREKIYVNPPRFRIKRGKGDKGRYSDSVRYDDARWNFEVPGAQLELHPIRPGKEGWDIRNLVMGRDITYTWRCGCELYIDTEGCEHYSFCNNNDECQRPTYE